MREEGEGFEGGFKEFIIFLLEGLRTHVKLVLSNNMVPHAFLKSEAICVIFVLFRDGYRGFEL